LHESATEYGAYLGEMRFSDDSRRIWHEDINRLGTKGKINEQEPHYAAKLSIGRTLMAVRRIREIFMNEKKKGIEIPPSAGEIADLHDQFYLKNAGISYTNLEKMCK
jgi:hypothetical protein